ncbi:MAG: WD40 repeat domain-containing protein [Rhodospirillaceae bacterium]|nr:WD40 repeat domain-containing protein [Rhodospirillaceae bacterium]
MAHQKAQGRVASWEFGDYAVAAAQNGRLMALGFGDGTIRLFDSETPDAAPVAVSAHKGACLSLTADIEKGAFLSGGDDGKLVKIAAAGAAETLWENKGKWIEHVTSHAGAGVRVFAVGKTATVMNKKGELRDLAHASTVGGLAINPKGKRLAVSHYNGVSLWWLASTAAASVLEWRGSHLQPVWSPDGDYLITAMQENALHGWRLSDGEHMRMTGYPGKVRNIAFTRRGHFLATTGSDSVICWPFAGSGPMGKPPAEFGSATEGALVSTVAANPKLDIVAAGFEDGSVLVGQPGSVNTIGILDPTGSPVTAMAWNPDGDRLLIGNEAGAVHFADFRG